MGAHISPYFQIYACPRYQSDFSWQLEPGFLYKEHLALDERVITHEWMEIY